MDKEIRYAKWEEGSSTKGSGFSVIVADKDGKRKEAVLIQNDEKKQALVILDKDDVIIYASRFCSEYEIIIYQIKDFVKDYDGEEVAEVDVIERSDGYTWNTDKYTEAIEAAKEKAKCVDCKEPHFVKETNTKYSVKFLQNKCQNQVKRKKEKTKNWVICNKNNFGFTLAEKLSPYLIIENVPISCDTNDVKRFVEKIGLCPMDYGEKWVNTSVSPVSSLPRSLRFRLSDCERETFCEKLLLRIEKIEITKKEDK